MISEAMLLDAHRLMIENGVPDKTLHIDEVIWLPIIERAKANAEAIERVRRVCAEWNRYEQEARGCAEAVLLALDNLYPFDDAPSGQLPQ